MDRKTDKIELLEKYFSRDHCEMIGESVHIENSENKNQRNDSCKILHLVTLNESIYRGKSYKPSNITLNSKVFFSGLAEIISTSMHEDIEKIVENLLVQVVVFLASELMIELSKEDVQVLMIIHNDFAGIPVNPDKIIEKCKETYTIPSDNVMRSLEYLCRIGTLKKVNGKAYVIIEKIIGSKH